MPFRAVQLVSYELTKQAYIKVGGWAGDGEKGWGVLCDVGSVVLCVVGSGMYENAAELHCNPPPPSYPSYPSSPPPPIHLNLLPNE